MKPNKIFLTLVMGVALVTLSACSWIKSGLPDKEKDYYDSQEIPPLELPPDLESSSTLIQPAPPLLPDQPASEFVEYADEKQPLDSDSVRLVYFDGGATRIQIDQSFKNAWRILGKAISRNSIEITDRNRAEGSYIVQFDPDEHNYEDGSLWDEFTFFFGDDQNQEEEYRIRLVENKELTEVIVTDLNDNPLSEGPGLILLNLLYETIQADIEEQDT